MTAHSYVSSCDHDDRDYCSHKDIMESNAAYGDEP